MSAQKMDRRVQRTHQILREALISLMLAKNYNKITIQEIIDRANVGRATFYNHYRDKDDLLLRGIAEFADEVTAKPIAEASQPAALQTAGMFRHARQNRTLHQLMLNSRQDNLMLARVTNTLFGNVERQVSQLLAGESTASVPLPILSHFLTGGLLGLINWWHEQDYPYTPEEMENFVRQMVGSFGDESG